MSEAYIAEVRVRKGKRKRIIATIKAKESAKESRFDREAEIRDKRINIVFKVIYVIAAFFATIFTVIAGSYTKGLSDTYILFAAADGFLLFLLIYMLVYIFNELKCLKLSADALSNAQHQRTEDAYSFIFIYFFLGGAVARLYGCLVCHFSTLISQLWFSYGTAICSIAAALLGNQHKAKYERVCACLSCMLWTVVAISILLGIAVK